MEALILTCSTGGGHNSAAAAIRDELISRGHHADMLDPYTLVGKNLDKKIGNAYIKLVRHAPKIFGCVYKMGEWYSKMPVKSPVYFANKQMEKPLLKYLENHNYDMIFITHIFPGQMIAHLKSKGIKLPKTIFIATDYTCIPFTREVNTDYYIVPNKASIPDFVSKGVEKEKIKPLGIPIRKSFIEAPDHRSEKDPNKHYLLLSSGSIGVNKMYTVVKMFRIYLTLYPDNILIVVCGNNTKLYQRLSKRYKNFNQIKIIQKTDKMAEYMKFCDLFISKPGGLSSTEAAAVGVPFIQIMPIPGCESVNIKFFSEMGMSIGVGNKLRKLPAALKQFRDKEFKEKMLKAQKSGINPNSTSDICDFAESLISECK